MEYSVNILIKAVDATTAPIEKIRGRMKALFAPVEKLQKSVKKFANVSGITKLGKSLKGLQAPLKKSYQEAGKLVRTIGLLGGGLLGSALAGFKALFLNVAMQNENLVRSMTNVTGSAYGAKEALAAVQTILRDWNTEDASNAYVTLKKAGLGTSEEDLKKLADIAGHTGKSLTEVADIMARLKDGNTGGLDELLGGNIKQFGDYIVAEFTDAEGKLRKMAVKQSGNASKDARALQKLMNKAVEVKGMAGGAERFGQSWQGIIQRMHSMWQRFRNLVMDSGPFKLLKEKFTGILATFEELEKNGGLQAIAEEWAESFCDAIESLWESGKELVSWFKKDFLPAFENIKNFLGGWGGVFKATAAILAGPFVLSLITTVTSLVSMAAALSGPLVSAMMLVTAGIVDLGVALLMTPVGWIIAAIAALAVAVYLIYKNWSKITGWLKKFWAPIGTFFKNLWKNVTSVFANAWSSIKDFVTEKINNVLGAFDKGFLQGMIAIFKNFNPVLWIAEALDSLFEKLFGFSLIDAGKAIISSLWEGLKSAWRNVVEWLRDAWDELTGWLPDVVKEQLGIAVETPQDDNSNNSGLVMQPAHAPYYATGAPTGAAEVMLNSAKDGQFGHAFDKTVRTEVVITGENLPPGISVSAPNKQADKTRIDCGYAMIGAH